MRQVSWRKENGSTCSKLHLPRVGHIQSDGEILYIVYVRSSCNKTDFVTLVSETKQLCHFLGKAVLVHHVFVLYKHPSGFCRVQ